MKRGTSALMAASSRTDCVSTITSRKPCSADTTQDAREQADVNCEALHPVDAGHRYAELVEFLKLFWRSAAANQRFYSGSTFEQSARDASAEIAGSSRHDYRRVIHDSRYRRVDSIDAKASKDPNEGDQRVSRSTASTDELHLRKPA
jgi:hypothetical protein